MRVAVHSSLCETTAEPVSVLLERVSEAAQAVSDGRLNFSGLHESIMQLENLILRLDASGENAGTLMDGLTPQIITETHNAYAFWQTRIDFEFADSFVRGEVSLSDHFLYDRFLDLVCRERELLSAGPSDRVLVIGSGPLPISAILFHQQTGCRVDCLAQDPSTMPLSRKILEKYGNGGSVCVFDGTEAEYNLSNYSAVIVDALARPRKAILKTLRKRCRPGCEILCRASSGLRQLFYEELSDRDLRGFHVKKQFMAEGSQILSTYLLEPAKSAAGTLKLEWLREVDTRMALQLLQLMNRTLKEETTIGFPGPIDQALGHSLMQQLGEDVAAGKRHVLVAEKDGLIVGQLILTPNSSPNHRHIVELTRGTIDHSFRGGGLSLRAFQEVAKKCDELGREVICLDVRAGTLAAMWWQHFGFKPYGLLNDYSRVGNKKYQGLYLTQTTDELKQRLNELAVAPGPETAT